LFVVIVIISFSATPPPVTPQPPGKSMTPCLNKYTPSLLSVIIIISLFSWRLRHQARWFSYRGWYPGPKRQLAMAGYAGEP